MTVGEGGSSWLQPLAEFGFRGSVAGHDPEEDTTALLARIDLARALSCVGSSLSGQRRSVRTGLRQEQDNPASPHLSVRGLSRMDPSPQELDLLRVRLSASCGFCHRPVLRLRAGRGPRLTNHARRVTSASRWIHFCIAFGLANATFSRTGTWCYLLCSGEPEPAYEGRTRGTLTGGSQEE
jgi:hypothetical protein